jgi:hypothetical protein
MSAQLCYDVESGTAQTGSNINGRLVHPVSLGEDEGGNDMSLRQAGRPWTLADDDMLRKLLTSGMKRRLIAQKMKRSKGAVNRVSAARLFDICKVLNVSLSSMFERNSKTSRDPRGRSSRTRARPNSRSSKHSQPKGKQGVPR